MSDESEPEKHFTFPDGGIGAVLYPADNKLVIKDFFVYCEGGVPKLKLDASFDVSGVHPDSHAWVLRLLLSRKTQLFGATPDVREQMERESDRYRERKVEYAALP